jgi:hypothetical protein
LYAFLTYSMHTLWLISIILDLMILKKNYEDPRYLIFCIFLLLPLSHVKIFFSTLCSQTLPVWICSLSGETRSITSMQNSV